MKCGMCGLDFSEPAFVKSNDGRALYNTHHAPLCSPFCAMEHRAQQEGKPRPTEDPTLVKNHVRYLENYSLHREFLITGVTDVERSKRDKEGDPTQEPVS